MPDLSGQTLGGYRILTQIGKGGMATVYKAFQPSLERYVAVKVLPAIFAEQDETFLKRFRLEARSIAHLRHPNILTIYEYGEEGGVTYLVMEFVEAGTLTQRLAEGAMSLAEIEPILRQVGAALSYAHDQGVVHRDVKPSNILLPKRDWPLLTDFGLAKIVGGSQLTITGTIAGTPAYMSPEQGQGEEVDHRSDIYSLGIVLYEMATGVVPYTAETPMAVIVKHIIEPLPLPRTINPDLPESVEAVILKALAKRPADRYARADQMAEAFSAARAAAAAVGTPRVETAAAETRQPKVDVAPAPPVAAGPRRRRALPVILAVAGGCGLVALAGLGLALIRGGDEPEPIETPLAEATGGPQAAPTRTLDQLMADGQARLSLGEAEAALADFQEAIAADPGNIDLYWTISDLLRDSGYPDLAKTFVDAATAVGPDESWFHDAVGWQYYYLGAYAEAAEAFRRAIDLGPEFLWSYIGLNNASFQDGDLETARMALDMLGAREQVSDPDLYESIGWGYFALEAYPQAQASFRQAVTRAPGMVGAWSGLVDSVYKTEGVQSAWGVVNEALASNPGDAPLHVLLGNLAWELGDAASAENAYRAAIELDPSYGEGYLRLADFLEDHGRVDEAFAALELGVERNPVDPWLREGLGQRLRERGDLEAAAGHFQIASDLDPTNGWFPLQAATAYYELTGDLALAAAFLERAAAAQPDDADLLDAVGSAYEGMGDCASAYGYYARALELNPDIESSQAGLTRCG